MNKKIPIAFITLALFCLLIGACFGILATLQYIYPEFLKETIPFHRMRELHVSSVVSWIILCAVGGVYFYIGIELKHQLYSNNLAKVHLVLYIVTGLCIYFSLLAGYMGGREYMTFFPLLIVPILLGWLLFGFNYYKTLLGKVKGWPVYMWMWGTGIVFMVYHLCEANFWIFQHFRGNFIRDLSVQWKSYGSFVGSWNMLIYGTAIFLMSRIKEDENTARNKKAFFFYFLGLSNLMFGWAHHIYPVPSAAWIRVVAYSISMTEWIILAHIIWDWHKTIHEEAKQKYFMPYRFLITTDFWVFMNLLMALLISIPFINQYTHGTHITVAHSMGTTIGINTTILLASVMFIVSKTQPDVLDKNTRQLELGLYIFNGSLVVFLSCLIIIGSMKGNWMYGEDAINYTEFYILATPWIKLFIASGLLLLCSFVLLIAPLVAPLCRQLFLKNEN